MTMLAGLRVLEMSANGAAAYAGKHLADWGADVLIVEPPGAPLRQAPPYYVHEGEQRSAVWAWLSRGKALLEPTPPPAELLRLCAEADVVLIESELAAPMLGLRAAEVRPRLEGRTTAVVVAPFATDGPYAEYAATDLGIQALGGWLGALGDGDREPVRAGMETMPRVTGLATAFATLTALRHVRHGGAPQYVEVSGQAVASSLLTSPWMSRSMTGMRPGRVGNRWPAGQEWSPANNWPSGAMACADGYVCFPPLTAAHRASLMEMLGLADEEADHDPWAVRTNAGELFQRAQPWLQARTRMEIVHEAQRRRIPSLPIENVDERLTCPQLNARGFWEVAEVEGKAVKVPRVPYRIEGAKPVKRGPLRTAAGIAPKQGAGSATASTTPPSRPFEGVRVLDLTHFWSGPHGTMVLGTLGADVIKVESVQHPDAYRYTGAPAGGERPYEGAALWNDTNCDKRGLTLDLHSVEGKDLFERLVPLADVVINNFSNRVMPGLGLDAKRLLELNPRMIVVTLPGYGPDGPWGDWVGFGTAFEQLDVCSSITGYPDRPPRIMGGFSDPTVGLHTAIAIELALLRREKTGEGAVVEVCQTETVESLWAPEHVAVQLGAPLPMRCRNHHAWMAPHNVYEAAGDDTWVSIAVSSDEEFQLLAGELGLAGLAGDARFATVPARKANEDELDRHVAAAVRTRDQFDLERRLQSLGVKACHVVPPSALADDPGLQHIGFFEWLDRPYSGRHPYKTWPFRFSEVDTRHRMAAPTLGEHTRDVLSGLLGLDADELDRLEREQVVGTIPVGPAR